MNYAKLADGAITMLIATGWTCAYWLGLISFQYVVAMLLFLGVIEVWSIRHEVAA